MTEYGVCDWCKKQLTESTVSLHKQSMCSSCFEQGLNHGERRALRLEERRMAKRAARRSR